MLILWVKRSGVTGVCGDTLRISPGLAPGLEDPPKALPSLKLPGSLVGSHIWLESVKKEAGIQKSK
jgi:hypothetical protein